MKKFFITLMFLSFCQKTYSCPVCVVAPGLLEYAAASAIFGGMGAGFFYFTADDSKAPKRSAFYTNYTWFNSNGISLGSDYSSQSSFVNGMISSPETFLNLNPYISFSYFPVFSSYKWQIGLEYFFNDSIKTYAQIEMLDKKASYLTLGLKLKKVLKGFSLMTGFNYVKSLNGEKFISNDSNLSYFVTVARKLNIPKINQTAEFFLSSFVIKKQLTAGVKYEF